MNLIQNLENKFLKKKVPQLKTGDFIKVYQKIKEGSKERIQIFEGIVLKTHGGSGLNGTFCVRRVSFGIGIERTFSLHSPTIIKIEKVKSVLVRRARLYYLRGLIGKKAKKQKELSEFEMWEEPEAEKEEEKLKAGQEADAKVKEETEKEKQKELDKKFEAAKGEAVIEAQTGTKEGQDDKSEEETRK